MPHDDDADATGASYVSRGGLKLAAAIEAFDLNVTGQVCADLGANVGGFTDWLLQHGAARIYAVDTGYGVLAWKLRQDARVAVHERTNALHFDPWRDEEQAAPKTPSPQPFPKERGGRKSNAGDFLGCDLVTVDLAWTRQVYAVPAALRWLRQGKHGPANMGRIISLIKPHYEVTDASTIHRRRGVLEPAQSQAVLDAVLASMPDMGVQVLGCIPSPIRGGAGKGRTGNIEYLALLAPACRVG